MKTVLVTALMVMGLLGWGTAARADTMYNASFEDGFSGWTLSGGQNNWVVDQQGGNVANTPTAYGWWYGAAQQGTYYAEAGNDGNESRGTITSPLWTAEDQYLNFWYNSNDNPYPSDPYGSGVDGLATILAANGTTVLASGITPNGGNNDGHSWIETSIDLASLGLHAGDQFYFQFTEVSSWSVLDDLSQSGPDLPAAPEPSSLALAGFGGLGLFCAGRSRRSKKNAK
jgi:PEP-CTERM motif